MSDRSDVVVVGAGLAGLVTARELRRAGKQVVVLEARDRVGGRLENASLEDGGTVEVGGQWIGPTQDRLAALADDLGVDTYPTYTEGEHLLVGGGRTSRFTGEFPPFEDATLTDLANAIATLEEMAGQLDPDAPWEAKPARTWDAFTFHSWIVEQVSDPTARAMLDLVAGAVFTASPAELSLLHVLFYIRSAGNLSPLLTDVEGGAQERRFTGGSVEIAVRLATELEGALRLGTPVRTITQTPDGVDVSGILAERVVVAVPPTVCDTIAFDPPLPAARAQLQRRMAAGSVIKCNVVYETPFWRDDGLSGRAIDPDGPVTITFDNSPPDGTVGVLLGFVEADHARRLQGLSVSDRDTAILDCLARYFGPQARSAERIISKDWDAEQWTRGCYGANLPPGAWTRYGPALRAPVGRVHWASAETSPVWANYMDGAVRSGERAAAEVLDALT